MNRERLIRRPFNNRLCLVMLAAEEVRARSSGTLAHEPVKFGLMVKGRQVSVAARVFAVLYITKEARVCGPFEPAQGRASVSTGAAASLRGLEPPVSPGRGQRQTEDACVIVEISPRERRMTRRMS